MIFIRNNSTDPFFNAAAEEYLFRVSSSPVIMIWQNGPSVVIGHHQDLFAEVNLDYTLKNNIRTVRRFSGGGAVYHDMGNINLTFINQENVKGFDFYTGQIVRFLLSAGIKALADERNSIYIDGFKISGSAQHVRGNKVLFHSTLLFSSDLKAMDMALNTGSGNQSPLLQNEVIKYVKSVRSPVTNIIDHMPDKVGIEDFKASMFGFFLDRSGGNLVYSFSDNDVREIEKLKTEKYSTTKWNYETRKHFSEERCSV